MPVRRHAALAALTVLTLALPAEARIGDTRAASLALAKKAHVLSDSMLLKGGRVVSETWDSLDPQGWTLDEAMKLLPSLAGNRHVRTKGYAGTSYQLEFTDGARAVFRLIPRTERFSEIEADAPGMDAKALAAATAGQDPDKDWTHGDYQLVHEFP